MRVVKDKNAETQKVAILNSRGLEVALGTSSEINYYSKAYDVYSDSIVDLKSDPIAYDEKMDLIEIAGKGVNASTILRLAELLNISKKEAAMFFHFSERSLHKYIKQDEVLDADSSEKIIKIFSLYLFGSVVFGEADKFIKWLFSPAFGLRNKKPVDLLNSSDGIDLVYDELSRIEYGDFA